MEGLPIRQWRLKPVVVNTAPPREAELNARKEESIWKELAMPRGSELYPAHSQELLRKARSLYLPNNRPSDEDRDAGEDEDADGEPDDSFVVQRWVPLSKGEEEPEVEYLAKRRNGLPTLYGGVGTEAPTTSSRKIKVKKIDDNGNIYFLDVLAPEGAVIEGEVQEANDIVTRTPAPGTVIEGVGVANSEGVVIAKGDATPTPLKRKPPPPKRKPKGPGRGRKKKVVIENATDGGPSAVDALNTTIANADGTIASNKAGGALDETGAGEETPAHGADEGSEEDDDEGEEGDDADREEGELSDGDESPSQPVTPSKLPSQDKVKSPTATSGTLGHLQLPETRMEGRSQQQDAMEIDVVVTSPVETAANSTRVDPMHIPSTEDHIVHNPNLQDSRAGKREGDGSALDGSPSHSDKTPSGLNKSMIGPGDLTQDLNPSQNPETQAALSEVNHGASETREPSHATLDLPTSIETLQDPTVSQVVAHGSFPMTAQTRHTDSVPSFSAPAIQDAVTVADPAADASSIVHATVPEHHNLLEGLTEPLPGDSGKAETNTDINLQLSDNNHASDTKPIKAQPGESTTGEDDIFGSLERHLDSKSG